MDREWHYYNDQFDSRETGEHGWRKAMHSDSFPPNKRESTHIAGIQCHKLCREGLWSIPAGLVTAEPPKGDGPFAFWSGPYAVSWWEYQDGRTFKLIRHNGKKANIVVEMQWRLVNGYSHIPGMENARPDWQWSGVQSRDGY